jgi:integrase
MTTQLDVLPRFDPPVPDAAQEFARLLDPAFLAEAGWDAERLVLCPPAEHPQLGRRPCVVSECGAPSSRAGQLCWPCFARHRASGLALEEFSALSHTHRRAGVGRCVVPDCPRPWKTSGDPLCNTHSNQRQYSLRIPLEEFVQHPRVASLPSFGPCLVASCLRDAMGAYGYCQAHATRFRRVRVGSGFDERRWRATEPSVTEANTVSFRGLAPLVIAELLFGLQQRVRSGARTKQDELKQVCDGLRAEQAQSVLDYTAAWPASPSQTLFEHFVKHIRRAQLSPEREVVKDVWDMFVFGHGGRLDFRGISQPWLRAAAKRWAADDIPHRRGGSVTNFVQMRIRQLERLSESLRAHRADSGANPAALGRADIEHHLHRLAFLNSQGDLSDFSRIRACRELRWVLQQMRSLGLTRPGQPLTGLPEHFALNSRDMPDELEGIEAGRDLPADVMRTLCSSLELVGAARPHARTAIELIIDTGRRPDEICELPWDCLSRDPGGKHALTYHNSKNHRQRRLPIPDATAALIAQQQTTVREKFPDTPLAKLKLLPSPRSNPYGRKAISSGALGDLHREWVDALPAIQAATTMVIDGKPVSQPVEFDKTKIFLYAYRHTYAQRHADAGVGIDVLCELMDHENMDTTRGYYQVGHERRREAVDKVALMRFDRHGNRIWRETEQILDSERLRHGLGEVAVPYGRCSEPANVQAGGGQCPIRFRCLGCEHFSSDISYLPDLEAYLADLLRNRERIASMTTADEWAKVEAMPSQQEIDRVRRLIRSVKEDLDSLTEAEHTQIREAITIVRRTRQVVLGIPGIRRPLPDLRPERSA